MKQLFCDCRTDAEKSNFFLSGRAVETGIIAAAISNDVAMAYHRCDEFKKELDALRAKIEMAENDAAHQKALAESALRVAEGWERKCDELRAKVDAMERQEPVAWMHETRRDSDVVTDAVKHVWGKVAVGSMAAYSIPLYALPGAKGEEK